jgi:SSS family solute:Na+ symporter
MKSHLSIEDYLVFISYFIIVAGYGWYTYKKKQKQHTGTKDFFLAEGSLTWWAIGASLIASNISAEQFIGTSGDGFAMGLGIASYELMSALTLIIIAIFFMPVYIKNKIFTMPQFLKQRYDGKVSMTMTVFWLLLYVFVNLTSILFLGALAISSFSGINFTLCMTLLAVFAMIVTLGGMKVIAYTDIIQVIFLIVGGLVTTWLALNLISTKFGTTGAMNGLKLMLEKSPDHFHLILNKTNPHFISMPGLTAIFGGMWIANLNYWGFNQYITQRALGADLPTARKGLLFAAFLKILMPVIICLPGIAVYVLYQSGELQMEMVKDGVLNKDNAYPILLNLLGPGLKGLAFAALTAAIVASLAGKVNSISTIFTLDIVKNYIKKDATEDQLVGIGRIVIALVLIVAVLVAPFMGINRSGGFSFIQEYTGFVSPGVVAMFLMGFFWKRTTARAALTGVISGFILSILFKIIPSWINLSFLYSFGFAVINPVSGMYEIPFLDRMGFVFLLTIVIMLIVTLTDSISNKNNVGVIEIDASMFKVSTGFIIGSLLVLGILTFIYITFW